MSVEIVDVEVENQLLNLSLCFNAECAVVHIWVVGSVTVESAVILLVSVENASGNYLKVVECLRKRRCSVYIPISAAISNHHTGKIDVVEFRLKSSLHVVLVYLPSEVWNVNTGITFSRDEELVRRELWEFGVPRLKSGQGVL